MHVNKLTLISVSVLVLVGLITLWQYFQHASPAAINVGRSESATNDWSWIEQPAEFKEGVSGRIKLGSDKLSMNATFTWTTLNGGKCSYNADINGTRYQQEDPNPCHPKRFSAWIGIIRHSIEEQIGYDKAKWLYDNILAWLK